MLGIERKEIRIIIIESPTIPRKLTEKKTKESRNLIDKNHGKFESLGKQERTK